MARILALDVGEKTIGVAVTDEAQSMAFPTATLWRQEGKKRDMAALRELVANHQAAAIIVGYPLRMDGTAGIQTEKIEAFIAVLRNHVRIPIIRQDERLSTREAERVLMQGGRRREERKKDVDSLAATLILQSYLDLQKSREQGTGNREQEAGTEEAP